MGVSNYIGADNSENQNGSTCYGSNYKLKKIPLYCYYYHFKGHNWANCYKLHGYPNESK